MYDEDGRKIDRGQWIGMPLEALGAAELEAYVRALEEEIARVEREIERKRSLAAAADSFFK